MSQPDSIFCQILVRALSGALATGVGLALAYFLVVGRYLQRIEHYKERIRVYKNLDRRAATIGRKIGTLEEGPELLDWFTAEVKEFIEYVHDEDALFVSSSVSDHCRVIRIAFESLLPDQYPEPPMPVKYPSEGLLNLSHEYETLREMIKEELSGGYGRDIRNLGKRLYKWIEGLELRLRALFAGSIRK